MAVKNSNAALPEIKPIEMVDIPLHVVGDSPLIVHAWSEKAKRMMLDAQMGKKAGTKKEPKNPTEDFIRSLYWLTPAPTEYTMESFNAAIAQGARFGFPITALKQSAISAAYRMGWVKDKASLRGAFFLDANGPDGQNADLFEIKGSAPVSREDMVRIGMGTADIRYRGQFDPWHADIILRYNKNGQYNLENLLNILNAGGAVCGIGEWRPEKDGRFGMYHIETVSE